MGWGQGQQGLFNGNALSGSKSGQAGNNPELNQSNPNALTAANASGSEATNAGQESGKSAENNSGENSESNAGMNAENNPGSNTEMNAGSNEENMGSNTETNAEGTAEINGEGPQNNTETNGESNAENNPGQGADTNPYTPTNVDVSPGGGPGNSCAPACQPLCRPGCDGSNAWQYNLPTINPIPTDSQVSQSINQQYQQSAMLAALIAEYKTLTERVMQAAQAVKYQTVNPDDIKPPDATPAPDDLVQKIRSAQLIQH